VTGIVLANKIAFYTRGKYVTQLFTQSFSGIIPRSLLAAEGDRRSE
jgi:hypothetical protein